MRVTLSIDGKEISVRTGTTVLKAAQKEGIYIPTLCDHPLLEPTGSCRLCVVEIEGMRGFPTACTTPVADGMVVRTETPRLRSLRRSVLELTLSEHPYTCLVCDKKEGCEDYQGTIRKVGVTTGCHYCPNNGACELQQLVEYLGLEEIEFPIAYRSLPVEQEDPFFDRDYNLCVLCGRCVRMCNDIRVNGTLTFSYRGDRTVVGTAFGKSHLDTGCEFCGACVDVCPTGALYSKRSKWEGCPEKSILSVCPYCSVGCSLSYNLTGGGLISTTPYPDGTLNKSHVCVRGRFGIVDMVHHPERLRKPMVKREGRWVETTWEDALDVVAEKFSQFRGNKFGCIASPQGTNEDAYTLQKFTRAVMESSNITNSSDFAQDGFVDSILKTRKANIPSGTVEDIDRAELIVVWGADLSVSHPIVSLRVKQAQKGGAKLVVVEPRKNKLAGRADFHVRLNPGMDRFLIASILKQLVDSGHMKDLVGKDWDKVEKTVKRLDPSLLKKRAGVSDEELEEFISLLMEAKHVLFLYGPGLVLQESAQETIFALTDLALLMEGGKVLPVVGESNLMGCIEMGCLGSNIEGIIRDIEEGKIQCFYVVGELPKLECLSKLQFLVVQSVFPPEWMDMADVHLPAAHLNEVDGTVTNFERRVQRVRRILKPLSDSKPDWWICARIAEKMGASGFTYQKSTNIFEEISSLVRGFEGLTPRKLGKKGMHIFSGKQKGNDVSRQFLPFSIEEDEAVSRRGYPYDLILGWNLFGYRNGAFTENIPGMKQIVAGQKVEIHPEDAEKAGVQNGERIRIKSRDGVLVNGIAEITDRVPRKTVFTWFSRNSGYEGGVLKGNHYSVKIEKGAHE